MKSGDSFYDWGSRVSAPVVFSPSTRPPISRPIGFCREPELNIEVVQAVSAEELRRYRDAQRERKKGDL